MQNRRHRETERDPGVVLTEGLKGVRLQRTTTTQQQKGWDTEGEKKKINEILKACHLITKTIF